MNEKNLIFIVSQPRSGSTYLQNLLSNNSQTNTTSETWLLLNYANQIKPKLLDAKFDNKMAAKAFEDYLSKTPDLNFKESQKNFLLSLYAPLFQGFSHVIDKTPRYWEILDELVLLFPESKIIILKRHPLAVAKSMIKTWSIDTIERLSYFKRDLLFAPQRLHEFSLAQESNPNVYSLKYEDLVQDTASETEKVYHWLGLTFDTSILDTSKNSKYKGKFGDPFQSPEYNAGQTKKTNSGELSAKFKNFISGYANYLGQSFLSTYGNYIVDDIKPKKTLAFAQFVHFGRERGRNYDLKKESRYLLKQIVYKLFK